MSPSAFDKDKFLSFINAREVRCPICSQDNWGMNGAAELRSFHGGELIPPNTVYPVVPVVCENCGFMALFSAIVTGAIPRDQDALGGLCASEG